MNFWKIFSVFLALSLSLVTFFCFYLQRSIRSLRLWVEQCSEGDMSIRVPEKHGKEIGLLVQGINKLVMEILHKKEAIQKETDEKEALLISMIESVVTIDNEERILSGNKAARELFRLSDRDKGRKLHEVIRNSSIQQLGATVLSMRSLHITNEDIQWDNTCLRAHGAPLKNSRGDIVGAILVFYDVTRFQKMERARKHFVANVSHELKTPLTAMKGFIEMALDPKNSDSQQRNFLMIIQRNTERLCLLIEDMLLLSHVDQKEEGRDMLFQPYEIHSLLRGVIRSLEISIQQKGIQMDIQCEKEKSVKVNASLMEHALKNLLDNSIKFSPPGGHIQVEVKLIFPYYHITISDHGCGIDPEDLPHIFERFYRGKEGRKREGTGLGLSIVKHIMRLHKGEVKVISASGQGSAFTVTLPSS